MDVLHKNSSQNLPVLQLKNQTVSAALLSFSIFCAQAYHFLHLTWSNRYFAAKSFLAIPSHYTSHLQVHLTAHSYTFFLPSSEQSNFIVSEGSSALDHSWMHQEDRPNHLLNFNVLQGLLRPEVVNLLNQKPFAN